MIFEKITNYFLPREIRHNKTHPKYNELRTVLSTTLIGLPLMLLFPPLIYLTGKPITGYLVNDLLVISIIISIRCFGHYRIPMTLTALVTYFIIYDWIRDSGLIYSSNVTMLHMYLLAAIWADKKYGWLTIFTNIALFGIIYYQTLHAHLSDNIHQVLGGPFYAFVMNCLITVFFGGFLAYLQLDQERDRARIRSLQDQRISVLDEEVKKRTEEINTMRKAIATDFHDETGNMLSAITRQALRLRMKLSLHHEVQPIVDSIIKNSNDLYASSKDFLWHLHHKSDDPEQLFDYLTAYGQLYYNQFDIAFSSERINCHLITWRLPGALDLLYILKEAMTNVAKHADAREVQLEMICAEDSVCFLLQDDGHWKEPEQNSPHYGLDNMTRRCHRNNFHLHITKQPQATVVSIKIPLIKSIV